MNATTKKPTKRDQFVALLEKYDFEPEERKFLEREVELLEKKNAAKKPTAQQTANNGIRETILEVLTDNGGMMTITDIQKANAELGEMSNQRVSALIRQMILAGEVERVEDKRKAYFKAV